MQRDALDVARTWGAGAASRYAFGRPEPREELRGEIVQVVGQHRRAASGHTVPVKIVLL
jgi:hypothetical protein